MNELNVAKPRWALDPTAIADVPTMTLGAYNTDSTVRLNWPNIESVIPKRSCIVAQCTTSDPAVTRPDSPTNANTPAAAARRESPSQVGSDDAANARRPTRDHTPIAAPMACTTSTLVNARRALGVCNSVITDDASWMTASAIAAISRGPPSADAITQRTTSHDECGEVARALLRAVPQTINRTGSSGNTPSSRPPIEIGT